MLGVRKLCFATFASFGLLIWAFSATALADPVINTVTFSTLGSWNDGPFQKNSSFVLGSGQNSITFSFEGVKNLTVETVDEEWEPADLGILTVKYKGDPSLFSNNLWFTLEIVETSPYTGTAFLTGNMTWAPFTLSFGDTTIAHIPKSQEPGVTNFTYAVEDSYSITSFVKNGKNFKGSVSLAGQVKDPPSVPEPGTLLLLGSGLSALALYGFRKVKK